MCLYEVYMKCVKDKLISSVLKEEYGDELWYALLEKTNNRNTVFCTHQSYPDVM
jgi:hypothetical protein